MRAGGSTKVQRRKPDSVCLNGADFKRPAPTTTCCNCTLEDTECDYGYMRDGDSKCMAIDKVGGRGGGGAASA